MKIITCFTESLGGGGAEHQIVLLAGMLAEKGYRVSIVTYAALPDHYDTPSDVRRIDIGETQVKGKLFKALIKAFKVFHYFLWLKTDCIISYRECANLRVLIPMFFRSRKIKVICSDRNTTINPSFQQRILFHLLYKRADYIVPNSITQTKYIARKKPNLSKKLQTIHNYTDLQLFSECKMPQETSTIHIGIFSRYSAQKNPIRFAESINELISKTDRHFIIYWYGSQKDCINGYNQEYLTLKDKIDELDIGNVLLLLPAVKSPASLMSKFHAICLPSLYEGFSNSIAEGICCGKPMLVSNVSDNSIMVHDGENGFLFNPNENESICSAFLKFFNLSYSEMCSMSHRSRKIAEDLFDKEHFIKQYIDLIEN